MGGSGKAAAGGRVEAAGGVWGSLVRVAAEGGDGCLLDEKKVLAAWGRVVKCRTLFPVCEVSGGCARGSALG